MGTALRLSEAPTFLEKPLEMGSSGTIESSLQPLTRVMRKSAVRSNGFSDIQRFAIEVALGLYACCTVWQYWQASKWEAIPLLVLNAIGFTVVGGLSVSHWWRSRPVV